jgi:hypothetical protein
METNPNIMEPLYHRVLEEGRYWQKVALQKLWELLEISMPSWVYKRLENKKWEAVWTTYFEKKTPQVLVSFPFRDDPLVFSLPQPHPSRDFAIATWPGGIEVAIKGLYARKEQAYLMVDAPLNTVAPLAGVRSFAPLFAFLGLADLEEALLALRELEDEEHRWKGAYFLARKGGTWVLFRGSLTGDPDLDGALLLGREVVLGTGEIVLRVKVRVESGVESPHIQIEEGSLAWGEEAVPLPPPSGTKFVLQKKNALIHLLRESLRSTSRLMPPPSPRMKGLIEELVETNPIEALKAEDLPSRAYMRLLSHY